MSDDAETMPPAEPLPIDEWDNTLPPAMAAAMAKLKSIDDPSSL